MQLPAISTIEFTNACNFKCQYCQRHHSEGMRPIKMLSPELVDVMIKRGDFENTLYCEFQQNGEPTMHPYFMELVLAIREAVPYVGLSTNGTYYKFKHADRIVYGLRLCHCVTLSIHPETTQFDVDNMVQMLSTSPAKLRIQTLDKNFYGLDVMKWEKQPGVFIDNYDLRKFGEINFNPPIHCLDPKASVTIQADGDVVACCNVVGKQRVYGNVKTESLTSIWKRAPKTMFEYCNTCLTPSPYAKRLNFLAETLNK